MKVLVIATHNTKKAGEMVAILSARFPGVDVRSLADYPGAPEPEETGKTYQENSIIKAESAMKFTSEWCIADDAGLEVKALDGAPGLYSKRFGGEDLPFPEKSALLLSKIVGLPTDQRKARFMCSVSVSAPGIETTTFIGICEGEIGLEPSGNGGFGYDPIFYIPEMNCTMADLTPEQKHAISHRGKVLKAVGDWLEASSFGR